MSTCRYCSGEEGWSHRQHEDTCPMLSIGGKVCPCGAPKFPQYPLCSVCANRRVAGQSFGAYRAAQLAADTRYPVAEQDRHNREAHECPHHPGELIHECRGCGCHEESRRKGGV